jgi:hypothetical protein
VSLALIKLLVGVGRSRRGERTSASQLVRSYAVGHLLQAIRARIPAVSGDSDPLDPARRFETDYPSLGGRLADALEQPLDDAARELLALTRASLESGWPDFPTAAADAIERRLGWAS